MKTLVLASTLMMASGVIAQSVAPEKDAGGDGLGPQKRAELREAIKAQQLQSMGIGSDAEPVKVERKLSMQELSEMREQLRREREAKRKSAP